MPSFAVLQLCVSGKCRNMTKMKIIHFMKRKQNGPTMVLSVLCSMNLRAHALKRSWKSKGKTSMGHAALIIQNNGTPLNEISRLVDAL